MGILPTDLTVNLIRSRVLPDHLINQTTPGMYLRLFHGRPDPAQDMGDWGINADEDIGPFKWAHFTYGTHTTLGWETGELWMDENFSPEACFLLPPNSLCRCGDMLYWNSVFYGDWELVYR